jgi:hypothetical protein
VHITNKTIFRISLPLVLSFVFVSAAGAEQATDKNSVVVHGELTETQIKNAIYRISHWQDDLPDTFVKAKDGSWQEGQDSIGVKAVALGDLNKDGVTDAAAVYWVSGGGTGAFMRVTAFVNKNGRLMAVDNKVLGDRVGIRKLTIKNGVIIADVLSHADSDGAGFPSLKRTAKYTLKDNKLMGPETMY